MERSTFDETTKRVGSVSTRQHKPCKRIHPPAFTLRGVTITNVLEIVADQPIMSDCGCRGSHEVFDAAAKSAEAQQIAVGICQQCPCIAACAQWAATLTGPELVSLAVVAGVAYSTPVKLTPEQRRRKTDVARVRRARLRAQTGQEPVPARRSGTGSAAAVGSTRRTVLVRQAGTKTDQVRGARR
jgi:hypothetical protein